MKNMMGIGAHPGSHAHGRQQGKELESHAVCRLDSATWWLPEELWLEQASGNLLGESFALYMPSMVPGTDLSSANTFRLCSLFTAASARLGVDSNQKSLAQSGAAWGSFDQWHRLEQPHQGTLASFQRDKGSTG